jgi:GNAT superfamily N-acetyltransferase
MFFHRDDPQSNGGNPWRQNRADLAERLGMGSTIGYLAYVDGKPAGWCNASLRSAYPTKRKGSEDDEVGVVACFVIAPPFRKHGVARRLLDAAIEGFRARGVKRVQAHPVLGTDMDTHNYHGPLPLYLGAGFEVTEENEKSAVVVKELH